MPTQLPCLQSYKNIEKLFSGISAAKVPDSFGHKFLTDTLGLKSNGDRPLIPFLRTLGFLDGANKPTNTYMQLKNPSLKAKAIANAIKFAYEPLFDADENANKRSSEDLRGLVSQVSGADTNTLTKTMGTLNSLLKLADFTSTASIENEDLSDVDNDDVYDIEENLETSGNRRRIKKTGFADEGLTMPFHFNIQVHLPANATEDVYLNIFNAIRKVFN